MIESAGQLGDRIGSSEGLFGKCSRTLGDAM